MSLLRCRFRSARSARSALLLLLSFALAGGAARPQEDPVKARLAVLKRDARDQSDKRRLGAWEELLKNYGPDGWAILRDAAQWELARDRKALEEKFKGTELARMTKKLEEELVARRKVAVACIYDVKRYPDEDHGRVGQPEVDRLVDRVTQLFDHPASFARQLFPELEVLAAGMEEAVVYLESAGAEPIAEMPTVAAWLDHFNALFVIHELGISNQQQEWNRAVAKYHAEELLTSADDQELACMNATNDYRQKMGMALLEIDERLVRAARKHSEEMKALHYFAHDSPVRENASVGARCAHEGYHGGGAENIAGSGDGVGAFSGWYNSSGHHRNMLGGHQQFGVGRGGDYPGELFTQDFGGGNSLRGRKIQDPQILYLGKLKKLDPKDAESETALAQWCRANQLLPQAKLHAERALALDPENAKAREVLEALQNAP